MTAYYNEFDPKAAAWLRELIKQGHIADGVVDDRSIEDVTPTELAGFTQCHFFAGIGVWSYALRRAGWADDRPVWTGSCPCQPFSAAGKGAGFADERHLWPAFHHLISQCQPAIVLGEQVASKDGLGWLDLVHADLEATGYSSGAVDLCAAGIGAPHIRQRLWWVGKRLADTTSGGRQHEPSGEPAGILLGTAKDTRHGAEPGGHDTGNGSVADTDNAGSQGRVSGRPDQGREDQLGHGGRGGAAGGLADTADAGFQVGRRGSSEQPRSVEQPERLCSDGGLANTAIFGRGEGFAHDGRLRGGNSAEGQAGRSAINGDMGAIGRPSQTNGHWRDADWLFCRDGKWRPVEPSTFPLAHGAAARVGRLRGYGNAIVAQAAQAFVESVMGE